MINLKQYKEFLSDAKSDIKLLSRDRDKLSEETSELEVNIRDLTEAREVVSTAGILAQDNTKTVFESLVSQALKTLFGEEYSFELESRFLRNQPEMEMFVIENGVKYSPKDEKGGAIIDILSFASRIVSWAIKGSKSQNTLMLDEPFRCLSKDILPFLAQLMQDISDELGLQILYITHEKQLAEVSCRAEKDRSYLVKKIDRVSKVERIV